MVKSESNLNSITYFNCKFDWIRIRQGEAKALPAGFWGDTLMVRIQGYEFCPKNCDVDHFHTGHFKNYNCEEDICTHITINDEE